MFKIFFKITTFPYFLFVLLFFQSSCIKKLQKEIVVYQNGFEDGDIKNISNGKITDYNGSKVLGRFADDGFNLDLSRLPPHDLLQVSFDLYIHDNWKGNSSTGITDDSDIWIMNLDGENFLFTTFSNNTCTNSDCSQQSYPDGFPFKNNPAKANAFLTGLPGACSASGTTTKYRIVRTSYHGAENFQLGCFAKLIKHQSAANPLCDASWSVDNILVTVTNWH